MSFLGINGAEFVVLLVVVLVILGPARTARALVWLQQGIKKIQAWSASMREDAHQLQEKDATFAHDLHEAFAGLDPTSLDPRTMIKDAVAEEMDEWLKQAGLKNSSTHRTSEEA